MLSFALKYLVRLKIASFNILPIAFLFFFYLKQLKNSEREKKLKFVISFVILIGKIHTWFSNFTKVLKFKLSLKN